MAKPAVSAFRALASDKRVAMLRALQECDEPMGVGELAEVVGLHVNTVREHLERLVGSGLVASEPEVRTTRGRPRLLYRAVERLATEADTWSRDRLLRVLVAGYGVAISSPAEAAEEAGLSWGRSLVAPTASVGQDPAAQQVDALVRCLDDAGFAPELDTGRGEVSFRRCPFRDVSRERPDVVCGVHLGIARGVLAEVGGPVVVRALESHLTSEPCVLHLAQD